jgi:hypothetical protein
MIKNIIIGWTLPLALSTAAAAAAVPAPAAAAVAAPGDAAVLGNQGFWVRAIAEVEVTATSGDRETVRLAPARRVVPGDEVIYTLEIRNRSAMALPPPQVDYPIPEHMRYLDDTAAGPGAEITYSTDGGHTFDRPENLKITGADGFRRMAAAADYTHIRFQLKNILKGRSVAFARFRAVVK